MSETIALKPGLRTGLDLVLRPGQILVNLIIRFLAPMFLQGAGGDTGLARMAAAQTVELSAAESQADLITVAKITAFGLAALSSLNLSMNEDLPLPLIVKLRANATACDRAEQQNRRVRESNRHAAQTAARYEFASPPDDQVDVAALLGSVKDTLQRAADNLAALTQATPEPEPLKNAVWAANAANMAAETAARLDQMPTADRRAAMVWIQVLTDSANALLPPTAGAQKPIAAGSECSAS